MYYEPEPSNLMIIKLAAYLYYQNSVDYNKQAKPTVFSCALV